MLFAGLQEVHKQTQPGAQTGSRHGAIAEKHFKDHKDFFLYVSLLFGCSIIFVFCYIPDVIFSSRKLNFYSFSKRTLPWKLSRCSGSTSSWTLWHLLLLPRSRPLSLCCYVNPTVGTSPSSPGPWWRTYLAMLCTSSSSSLPCSSLVSLTPSKLGVNPVLQ